MKCCNFPLPYVTRGLVIRFLWIPDEGHSVAMGSSWFVIPRFFLDKHLQLPFQYRVESSKVRHFFIHPKMWSKHVGNDPAWGSVYTPIIPITSYYYIALPCHIFGGINGIKGLGLSVLFVRPWPPWPPLPPRPGADLQTCLVIGFWYSCSMDIYIYI